jgi:hypothetical protein
VILPHGANGPAVDIITTKVKSLLPDAGVDAALKP